MPELERAYMIWTDSENGSTTLPLLQGSSALEISREGLKALIRHTHNHSHILSPQICHVTLHMSPK